MMIPYGTDAPIYHRPFATGGMIALNIALYAWSLRAPEAAEPWSLALGSGLHPLQWVSHCFLHAGIFHLVGNIIFLWAFGIIVEGKVGPWGFLACYVAMGAANGALMQVLCLGLPEPTSAVGASAAIFGLMALCLVWAPKNTISTFVAFGTWYRIYADTWEIPIVWFAIMDIGWEVWDLFKRQLLGLSLLSSAVGHLGGAVFGLALGAWMVKANLVDCEGWDIFAVMAGTAGRTDRDKFPALKTRRKAKSAALRERMEAAAKPKRKAGAVVEAEAPVATAEARKRPAIDRVVEKIELGEIDEALRIYDKTARTVPGWPGEVEALDLIKRLHARGRAVESIPVMRDFCKNHPDGADRVRLKLAQVLIRDTEHPTQGLRVLEAIPDGALPANLEAVRGSLARQARAMIEDGVLEMEGEY